MGQTGGMTSAPTGYTGAPTVPSYGLGPPVYSPIQVDTTGQREKQAFLAQPEIRPVHRMICGRRCENPRRPTLSWQAPRFRP